MDAAGSPFVTGLVASVDLLTLIGLLDWGSAALELFGSAASPLEACSVPSRIRSFVFALDRVADLSVSWNDVLNILLNDFGG